MKTQISRDSFRSAAGFSGVYLQQGRMIVDADWNEATDIGKARLESALHDAIASGAPRTGGLAIIKPAAAVLIRPGALYVEGVPARMDGPAAGLAPGAQPAYRNAPALPASNYRLYADVWERPVTALEDEAQLDAGLHGADTATRTRTMLQVKWCAAGIDPADPAVNPPLGSAPLSLRLRQVVNALDSCDPCAAEVEVDERIGNYLFRVEVHDVFDEGPNRMLVLKWSRDNGAEAYTPTSFPAGFDQGGWVWEFFDGDSENLLGHHFPAGQPRRRGVLGTVFNAPAAPAPNAYVRQWDGFAKLDLTSLALVEGSDRGEALSGALAADAHGHVALSATTLSINLELMELHLGLAGSRLVAGDYWQATVREATDASGDWVLGTSATAGEAPRGIRHHYLPLAAVDAAGALVLQTDPERRRMSFPPLTDIRAIDVGFTPTCAGLYGTAPNVQAALDALCSIGAEDIGYTLPACGTAPGAAPTVRSLMASVPNFPNLDLADKNPSVKDMLDALLCHLNAARLPYDGSAAAVLARWRDVLEDATAAAPTTTQQAIDTLLLQLDSTDIPHTMAACAGSGGMLGTVRELMGVAGGAQPVAQLIESLYCRFNATHLPLDKDLLACADLRTDASVVTVQDALDKLCEQAGNGCTISVPVGQLEERLRQFAASNLLDLSLCLLPGTHALRETVDIRGKRSLRIGAAAASASILSLGGAAFNYQGGEIVLEGIQVQATGNGHLQLDAGRVSAIRCEFSRSSSIEGAVPMVRAGVRLKPAHMVWRDNTMNDVWWQRSRTFDVLVDVNIIGNRAVAKSFQEMFADETVFTDARRFEAGLSTVIDVVSELPREERLRLADVIGRNIGPAGQPVPAVKKAAAGSAARKAAAKPAAKASTKAAAASRASAAAAAAQRTKVSDTLSRLSGTQLLKAQSDATLRNELLRGSVVREGLRDALLNDVLDVVLDSGFNIALAISSPLGDATLADNQIAGEVLLMNDLERSGTGAPAAQVGVDPALAVRRVDPDMGVTTAGSLHCSGNRIHRLWALVPNSAISDGRLGGVVIPGWGSATLTGNQLGDYGQSVVARMLNLAGNHVANGSPGAPTAIARLFAIKAALTGNTAQFADDFTPVFVTVNVNPGSEMGAVAANLFAVLRHPT
ncbi:DUF6519 domain-containing protein [Variovorax saccharolyticus]|uniref:DUF6519 domain-containing protein n=1 Tax=Variovorax saccharolyticus TaxID=3053516 RepID=UPI00257813B7|nr:DUF6519 domain-containing protein [Variovorax sp. J31P216]MDM0030038.1 DUF6519 domain-containing protein [Variovorax sp. J31P216]